MSITTLLTNPSVFKQNAISDQIVFIQEADIASNFAPLTTGEAWQLVGITKDSGYKRESTDFEDQGDSGQTVTSDSVLKGYKINFTIMNRDVGARTIIQGAEGKVFRLCMGGAKLSTTTQEANVWVGRFKSAHDFKVKDGYMANLEFQAMKNLTSVSITLPTGLVTSATTTLTIAAGKMFASGDVPL